MINDIAMKPTKEEWEWLASQHEEYEYYHRQRQEDTEAAAHKERAEQIRKALENG